MKHLSEEELVERYYGGRAAGGTGADPDSHLQECEDCAAALAALESDLAAMPPLHVPERDAGYAERMWARVEAGLPPRHVQEKRPRRLALWRALPYAAACAVLVAGGFYGGRVYEQWQHHKMILVQGKVQPPVAAPQPKVVVVLGDHLDRSERLLVELKHADAESPELVNPLRDEARGLLAANRVFRDDAEKEGDPALTEALNHLDRLLTELADQPGGLDAAALTRLRDEMNADGLLFEVRVLRSKNPHRTKAVRVIAKEGAA
jgi:hypothetical protein